jgi:hypothetical protein
MLPFDTLDDVELSDTASITDVYNAVLGPAMEQDDVVGCCTTGAITLSYQYHVGNHKWGKKPVAFASHFETWQVRSSPKGRIGKPLELDEFREVLVLVRNKQTRKAQITTIKLWTLPGLLRRIDHTKTKHPRGAVTYGAVGISYHGVAMFNERAHKEYFLSRNCNCHSVLSAINTLTDEEGDRTCRVESDPLAHLVIAGHLAGFVIPDTPLGRNCEDRMTEEEYNSSHGVAMRIFQAELAKIMPTGVEAGPQLSVSYIFSAQCIFEQAGFIALLDEMASQLYDDAIADDRHQPCSVALMLAIAVRIACNPTRWCLPPLLGDDAYAVKMVSTLFDTVQPSVLRGLFEDRAGTQTYGIDVAITHACESMKGVIHKLQHGKINGVSLHAQAAKTERIYRKTMAHLFCAGVAVCEDVCGLQPQPSMDATKSTSFRDVPSWYTDSLTESSSQSAHAAGLGQVTEVYPRHRTSTRGKRQGALLRVLQSVEDWICTGKYQGSPLSQPQGLPTGSALVEPVRADDIESAATVETAETRGSPLPTPTPPSPASVPRKKKSAKTAPPPSKDAATDSMLANNGRRRSTNERNCIEKASESLLKVHKDLERQETTFLLAANLKGSALDEASGVMTDLLQVGAVFGMGQYFDAQTYAVGQNGPVQCASCPRMVNVIESVAFAGAFGKCVCCNHPRCLHCVTEDIDLVAANEAEAELLTEPTSQELSGCKMCCAKR